MCKILKYVKNDFYIFLSWKMNFHIRIWFNFSRYPEEGPADETEADEQGDVDDIDEDEGLQNAEEEDWMGADEKVVFGGCFFRSSERNRDALTHKYQQ